MRLSNMMVPVMLVFLGSMAGKEALAQEAGEDFDLYLEASESRPYDATDKVENATCTAGTGWSRHRNDAAAGYNKHNPDFDSDIHSGVGIESWYRTPEQNCELIWQEVSGLLPGRYKVTAYAVGQVYNDAGRKGQNVGSIYLFANGQRTRITSNKWEEVEVVCDVPAGGSLRIGISAGSDNANDWVSIANVRLACIGAGEPEKIALNESYDICAANADTYADVWLSKAISDTYPTWFCVPFPIKGELLSSCFKEVKEVTAAGQDGTTVRLDVQDATEILPGRPYLVKALRPGHTLMVVEGVLVTPSAPQPVSLGDGITLTGTYRRTEGIAGAYLLSEDGQTLTRADSYAKAKGFSAYLTVEGSESRTLNVNVRHEATGIAPVAPADGTADTVDVFTLTGIRIRKDVRRAQALDGLQRGIYIIGNRKFIKP